MKIISLEDFTKAIQAREGIVMDMIEEIDRQLIAHMSNPSFFLKKGREVVRIEKLMPCNCDATLQSAMSLIRDACKDEGWDVIVKASSCMCDSLIILRIPEK